MEYEWNNHFLDEPTACNFRYLLNMSKVCVSETAIPPHLLENCFSKKILEEPLKTFTIVWCLIIAISGGFGNLLTIFAIPTAIYKRRSSLHQSTIKSHTTIVVIPDNIILTHPIE